MHTYQQELINQKLANDISEHEITEYYGKNKELFKLEGPLIKGLFIKVPLTAPQLNNVRSGISQKNRMLSKAWKNTACRMQ